MKKSKKHKAHRCKSERPAETQLHKPRPTRVRKLEKRRVAIIELARERREEEGTIEIDDNAILSEGTDNGCYVQAWVWADFSDTKFDKDRNRGYPRKQPSTANPV